MNKKIFYLSFFLALFVGNLYSQTVFVTKTGKKYHSSSCRYLSKSSFSVSLIEAQNNGFSPCSKCSTVKESEKNDVTTEDNKMKNENVQKEIQDSKDSTKATQCSAITKSGKRCSRMTTNSNGKCTQHGKS